MNSDVVVVAHDIRSLWNVGSLFRTCDAFGVSELILSGYTATPPRREISKTALGADEWIPWRKVDSFEAEVLRLKSEGRRIVGLELSDGAVDVSEYRPTDKTVLVLGHEVTGVPEEHLKLCDDVVRIPMRGKKESLNVSVAAGVALFALTKRRDDDLR